MSSRWTFPVTVSRPGGRPTTSRASPTACTAPSRRHSCNRPSLSDIRIRGHRDRLRRPVPHARHRQRRPTTADGPLRWPCAVSRRQAPRTRLPRRLGDVRCQHAHRAAARERTEPRAVTFHPRQDLVLGYWRELLERPVDELADLAANRAGSVAGARACHTSSSPGTPSSPATSSG